MVLYCSATFPPDPDTQQQLIELCVAHRQTDLCARINFSSSSLSMANRRHGAEIWIINCVDVSLVFSLLRPLHYSRYVFSFLLHPFASVGGGRDGEGRGGAHRARDEGGTGKAWHGKGEVTMDLSVSVSEWASSRDASR